MDLPMRDQIDICVIVMIPTNATSDPLWALDSSHALGSSHAL